MAFEFDNNNDIFQFLLSRSGKMAPTSNGFGNYPMTASNNKMNMPLKANTKMPSNIPSASNRAIGTPNMNTSALSNQNMQKVSNVTTGNIGSVAESGKMSGFSSFFGGGGSGAGGYISQNNSIDDQTTEQVNSATSALNSIPFVGAFKAIGDSIEGIGGAIGGESGANMVQGFTNPIGRQIEVLKNKNYTNASKAIATLFPFLSGFVKPKAVIDNPEQDRMNKLKDYQLKKIQENNFLKSSDFYKGMINQ